MSRQIHHFYRNLKTVVDKLVSGPEKLENSGGPFSSKLHFVRMNLVQTEKLDEIVRKAMRDTGVPGAGLTVVMGDEVFARGYGVKQIGQTDKVGPDTLFAIASVSKAFVAAAVATLIDDGKMNWDDLARKHLPSFRLLDPAADANVTIRDLLSHRTGLPRHDGLWYRTNLDRTEILRRMAFLKPTATFRGAYQYNNLCYMAVGAAIAATTGEDYEEFLCRRLLNPLGMRSVTFSGPGLKGAPNHAVPHSGPKGRMKPIEPLDFMNAGPGGAINASPNEIALWLRFQLSGGVAQDGSRLVSEKHLYETHSPQMIVHMDEVTRETYPDRAFQEYAFGWIRFNWQSHLALSHSGAIDGFRSNAVLLPHQKVGFAVLTNGETYFADIVRNELLDLLLEVKDGRDWKAVYRELARKNVAQAKEDKRERVAKRQKGTKPSLPLDSYVGRYEGPGYGIAEVRREADGKLWLRWETFDAPLGHWHHNTFFTDTDQSGFSQYRATFSLNANGEIRDLTLFDQMFTPVSE